MRRNNLFVFIGIFLVILACGVYVAYFSQSGSVFPSYLSTGAIIVPDDYSTISAAVNASSDGGTIFVREGIYIESVTVNKTLTIIGENKETTIVDGNNIGPTFLVRADHVEITGFKIRNVENAPPVSGSRARLAGIHLLDVHGCKISGNAVLGCGKGVWIYGGFGNTISDNTFVGNNYGVLVERSSANFVRENTVSNGWGGIWLISSADNTLRNNKMLHNAYAFGVEGEELQQFMNDVDLSNMIDSKKVYYLLNKRNLIIDSVSFPDIGALILANCRNVTVQNLSMQNNHVGIHMVGTVNSTIICNFIENNTVGIWAQFSENCVISQNNVKQNINCGIRVDASSHVFVLENFIEQALHESQFIRLVASSNCTIAGNTLDIPLSNSLPWGIYLEYSNSTVITGNSQAKTNGAIYGIALKRSYYNLIQSNTFANCVPGILLQDGSSYNRIIANTFCTERGYHGVELNEAYFNELRENVIYNFHTGLMLSNAKNNIISKNIVTSRAFAVQLFKFNNNLFEGNQFYGATGIWDMGKDLGSPSINTWK